MKNLSQNSIIHSKMNIPTICLRCKHIVDNHKLLIDDDCSSLQQLGAQCQLTTMHLLCLSLWFCSSSAQVAARLLSRVKLLQLFSTKVQEPAHSQTGWVQAQVKAPTCKTV